MFEIDNRPQGKEPPNLKQNLLNELESVKSNQDQSTDVASRFSVPYGSKNALASKAKVKQKLTPIEASRTPVKQNKGAQSTRGSPNP